MHTYGHNYIVVTRKEKYRVCVMRAWHDKAQLERGGNTGEGFSKNSDI
jgi:hypothetical protein